MNHDYLQSLRYKLQKRVRRLNSASHQIFHSLLRQWWGFLASYPLLQGIVEELETSMSHVRQQAETTSTSLDESLPAYDDEKSHVALCYFMLKNFAAYDNVYAALNQLRHFSQSSKFEEILDHFREIFLEPFYDYLDEQLDEIAAVLGFLKRYKHRCEWFRRQNLYTIWSENTAQGEKLLARDLYEYLYEQGIEFSIEPVSVSGEADLVTSQIGDDRLIADAKIFDPGKSKSKDYIAKGFHQIYTYTLDYNQSVGYLIIFKTCEQDLKFVLSETSSHIPFVKHNNKTIFLITIDLFPYDKSASKRGILKTIEVTEADLIKPINEVN